jgi:putative glutamine amidotransferase
MNGIGLHQATYQAVLTRMGVRTEEVTPRDPRSAAEILANADALVLTGGGDVDPEIYGGDIEATLVDSNRDAFEIALLREALARDLPLLAVCRGHQVLNVALGGTLRDLRADPQLSKVHGISARSLVAHSVEVRPTSLLARLWDGSREEEVNSFHGQAIGELAPGLIPVALAPDGVIEAVEIPDRRFALGVQWHPEMMNRPSSTALWSGLIESARAYRADRLR